MIVISNRAKIAIVITVLVLVFIGWLAFRQSGGDGGSKQTAQLQYEKASISYPSSWKLTQKSVASSSNEGTADPGNDSAVLVSPTGLTLHINTGAVAQAYPNKVQTNTPVSVLGKQYYLSFLPAAAGSDKIGSVWLNDGSSGQGLPIPNRNVKSNSTATGSSDQAGTQIYTTMYLDYGDNSADKKASDYTNDSTFKQAKEIIGSYSY